MSQTPDYVLAAVDAFVKEDHRFPLVNMFENGIPLHTYPESRDLIVKLMRGDAIRPKGRRSSADNPVVCARDTAILHHVAQLHGAGLALISNGEGQAPSACGIVARFHGLTPNQIKAIWNKGKGRPDVVAYLEFGRTYAAGVMDCLRIAGDI